MEKIATITFVRSQRNISKSAKTRKATYTVEFISTEHFPTALDLAVPVYISSSDTEASKIPAISFQCFRQLFL